jgi:LCP family protein required for cell wall assembly
MFTGLTRLTRKPARRGPARRGPARYRTRVIGRAAAASMAFVLLVGSGYAWATFANFTASVHHGPPVPALAKGAKDIDGAAQNILLIGNDSRAGATRAEELALHTGSDGGSVNTDTMIILHVPADNGRPSVISFPRDSWVSIPGHGKGKLNSAYGDAYTVAKDHHRGERAAQGAGIELTIRTLEHLTGLHIDHYMQVDLLGFYRISNAIGGVSVCLLHAQNASTDRDAYGQGYSGIDLPAGISVIKGKQALAFVRQRHGLPGGDLDRIKRQQYFLAAAFKKVESAGVLLNPFKLSNLLDAVGKSLLTDPALNLLSFARSFELLSAGSVRFYTLPNEGSQLIYPDGVSTSIVKVDNAAIPGFIRTIRGLPADPRLARAPAAQPAHVTLDVLNGADVYKLATRNARQLRRLGFHVDVIDSTASTVRTSLVDYPPGQQSAAKAVAAEAPGIKLVETNSVKRVTLVLGTDGRQVSGLGGTVAKTPSSPSKSAAQHHDTRNGGLGCIN